MRDINGNVVNNNDLCLIVKTGLIYAVYYNDIFYYTDFNHQLLYRTRRQPYNACIYKIQSLSSAEKKIRDDILKVIQHYSLIESAKIRTIIPNKDLIPNSWYFSPSGKLCLFLGKGEMTILPLYKRNYPDKYLFLYEKLRNDPFSISLDEYKQYCKDIFGNIIGLRRLKGYFYSNFSLQINWLKQTLNEDLSYVELLRLSCNDRVLHQDLYDYCDYSFVTTLYSPRKFVKLYKTNLITKKFFIWVYLNKVVIFNLK